MIQVLLATYNGESYLKAQIDSLLSQTFTKWQLLVHDDDSNDKTVEILLDYQQMYPEKIKVIDDSFNYGSACKNFSHLLSMSTSKYVMFCDQDDVWLPEKIEKSFIRIKEMEDLYGNIPIVVHTDLAVVDESLNLIASSMFDYQGLNNSVESLLQALVKNSVTGCAAIINRKAIEVSLPILPSAVMHDWWVSANVLKYSGKIEFINESLIKYRQHSGNALGAKKQTISSLFFSVLNYSFNKNARSLIWEQAVSIDPKLNKLHFFLYKLYSSLRSFDIFK